MDRLAGRSGDPTSSSTPATTSGTPRDFAGSARSHSIRCAASPVSSCTGRTTTPRPRRATRSDTSPDRRRRPRREPLDTQALDTFLADELGWLNLNNAAGSLEVAGLRIDVFGVSDAHRGWDRLDVLPELLDDLQADVAPAAVTLGVTHAPYRRVLDCLHRPRRRHDLRGSHARRAGPRPGLRSARRQLRHPAEAGTRAQRLDARRETVPLNVSAGLGHSIYAPVRFACLPEASLITLLPRD